MISPRRLRTTALWLTGFSLLVVVISAYLRLDAAGLGCSDWPACYGRLPMVSDQPYYSPLRLAHRTLATLSLLLTLYLLWQCKRSPALTDVARPVAWLLYLMLALAVLGVWSGEPRLTVIVFLNLLGGLSLVSFSWRIVLAIHAVEPPKPHPPLTLRAGALLLTVTILLGAGIGAGQLALACRTFPACDGQWWPRVADWSALLAFASWQARPESGVALHLLHRYSALGSLLLLGHGTWTMWRGGDRRLAAGTMLAMLACTAALGLATVISDLSIWLTMAHGLCAAITLAALATLLKR